MVIPYDDRQAEQILEQARQTIRARFVEFFSQADYLDTLEKGSVRIKGSEIKAIRITEVDDLENLLYGHGFYVIVTNFPLVGNECTYSLGEGLTAIYRGQGERLKLRIESHLFHSYHLEQRKDEQKKYEVSLSLDDRHVDIDQRPFRRYTWVVVQHPMTDASQVVREQMELAFDEVFTKPAASER